MSGAPESPEVAGANVAASEAERTRINGLVDARLAERWHALVGQVKLTAWVLGGLVAVLGLGDALSRRAVTEAIHTYILGFDRSFTRSLDRAYKGAVVLSYSNAFALDTGSMRFANVLFYADPSQHVDALVRLNHVGDGKRAMVEIRLDAKELVYADSTGYAGSINLSRYLRHPDVGPINLPDNVHELSISIGGSTGHDKVLGSVLVNVKGREEVRSADTASH
jgi:hypothetical protein